jgi:uncharacterized protein (DUF697 family)/tellurite resistance protein
MEGNVGTKGDSAESETIQAQISSSLEEAGKFISVLGLDAVRNGTWFYSLLEQVVRSYERGTAAASLQRKYPGLPADDVADILISLTARYAAIAGAIVGGGATMAEVLMLPSGGQAIALFVGAAGGEMVYLTAIQMRLVLDLATLFGLQLDPDDPEDVLMVFGWAVGVQPVGLLGRALDAVPKTQINRETLRLIQDIARRLGFKILQRTILKYAVPIASAAVGSGYNFVTTKSIGEIARNHFKRMQGATAEARSLVAHASGYDLTLPATILCMAQADGKFSDKEKELYKVVVSRLPLGDQEQADFRRMVDDEESLLEAIEAIKEAEARSALVDLMALVAVYDGEFCLQERDLLLRVAERLDVPIDIAAIERKCEDYREAVRPDILGKGRGALDKAGRTILGRVGRATGRMPGWAGELGQWAEDSYHGAVLSDLRETIMDGAGQAVGQIWNKAGDIGHGLTSANPAETLGKTRKTIADGAEWTGGLLSGLPGGFRNRMGIGKKDEIADDAGSNESSDEDTE